MISPTASTKGTDPLRNGLALLGALLAGIIGATAGSYAGALSPDPLPGDTASLLLAQEILPGVTPAGERDRRDFLYGSRLGDEEYGPGYVSIAYEPDTDRPDSDTACRLDHTARTQAAAAGWNDFGSLSWYPCENWSAERDHLLVTYTHDDFGPVLTFYRASSLATAAGTLIGAILGACAGATAFHALRRRRLLLVILSLPGVLLIPVAALYLIPLIPAESDGPAPPLWAVWVTLHRLFFFY
ncbi:hypothetical protein ACQP2E_20440 [Actinoplanes sp. CA-015351]|uniref:hypothetical protein n=1 Tax=Actinoplanes sp. CA-015351 TaxID=3239897 RepID=UPI003D991391